MPDYKKMYFTLFNVLTDAIQDILSGETKTALKRLMEAQRAGEELYMASEKEQKK